MRKSSERRWTLGCKYVCGLSKWACIGCGVEGMAQRTELTWTGLDSSGHLVWSIALGTPKCFNLGCQPGVSGARAFSIFESSAVMLYFCSTRPTQRYNPGDCQMGHASRLQAPVAIHGYPRVGW